MIEDRTELLSDIVTIAQEDSEFLELLATISSSLLRERNTPRPPAPDYERLMNEAGSTLIPDVFTTERWGHDLVGETRILRGKGYSVQFHFKPYDGKICVSADIWREHLRTGLDATKEGRSSAQEVAERAYAMVSAEIKNLKYLKLQLSRVASDQCAVQDGD